MQETWRPIVGYEGAYEVSDLGRVRSLDRKILCRDGKTKSLRGKILTASPDSKGYPHVVLCGNGHGRSATVHSLVAAAFLGPRPPNKEVAHRDGKPSNPRLSNLRYKTHKDNQADRVVHGTTNRGERHGCSKLTDSDVISIRERLSNGDRIRDLALEFKVARSHISAIKLHRIWRHLLVYTSASPKRRDSSP